MIDENKQEGMLRAAEVVLEKYIEGKDQDKFRILEEIYIPNARVSFEIDTDSITFPSEIQGNKEIAKVLSADFNKQYDRVKTYYLTRRFPEIDNFSILNQGWLVIMREKKNNHIRAGTGHYNWFFEKQRDDSLKIRHHHICIGVMLSISDISLGILDDLQKRIPYPWASEESVVGVLDQFEHLKEIHNYLQKPTTLYYNSGR